jgi:hypothetical protein
VSVNELFCTGEVQVELTIAKLPVSVAGVPVASIEVPLS